LISNFCQFLDVCSRSEEADTLVAGNAGGGNERLRAAFPAFFFAADLLFKSDNFFRPAGVNLLPVPAGLVDPGWTVAPFPRRGCF
jgi:hypothetical protein